MTYFYCGKYEWQLNFGRFHSTLHCFPNIRYGKQANFLVSVNTNRIYLHILFNGNPQLFWLYRLRCFIKLILFCCEKHVRFNPSSLRRVSVKLETQNLSSSRLVMNIIEDARTAVISSFLNIEQLIEVPILHTT